MNIINWVKVVSDLVAHVLMYMFVIDNETNMWFSCQLANNIPVCEDPTLIKDNGQYVLCLQCLAEEEFAFTPSSGDSKIIFKVRLALHTNYIENQNRFIIFGGNENSDIFNYVPIEPHMRFFYWEYSI